MDMFQYLNCSDGIIAIWYMHMSKLMKMQILNVCNFLYINYTSIKFVVIVLFKKEFWVKLFIERYLSGDILLHNFSGGQAARENCQLLDAAVCHALGVRCWRSSMHSRCRRPEEKSSTVQKRAEKRSGTLTQTFFLLQCFFSALY